MTNKIVITGHATGLGASIARRFELDGYTVSGWDMAENPEHNLMSDSVLAAVAKDCEDAMYFINNAQPRQVDYLEAVHELWLGQMDRVIINIGSCSTYFQTYAQFTEQYHDQKELHTYYKRKALLDQAQKDLYERQRLRQQEGPLMIMSRPCWMDTSIHKERAVRKLDTEEVTDMIFQVLSQLSVFVITDFVIAGSKFKC
jgi:hypothetical protein